jgi:hypothetical protein
VKQKSQKQKDLAVPEILDAFLGAFKASVHKNTFDAV